MPREPSLVERIDDVVYRVERALILACVIGMTALVSADVIQRTFSRPVGKTASLVAWLADGVAGPLSPEARARIEGPVGEGVFWVLALIAFVLATHASRQVVAERAGGAAPAFARSAVAGAGVLAAFALVVHGLLWLFPSSVPGAQKFALGLMLWAGMLGASVATRERRHIILDAIVKKMEGADRRRFALLGGSVTAVFCAFVGVLGAMQLWSEIHDWATHEGVGLYESLPIPTWLATLAIPTAFFLMGARFLGFGVRDYLHGPPAGGDGGHGVDLEELAKQPAPDAEGAAPAPAPTTGGAR